MRELQSDEHMLPEEQILKKDKLFIRILLTGMKILFGAIFVYASIDKILYPAAFAKAIYNYHILPGELINIAAIILPWLEFILGCFLFIGVWIPGALLIGNLLLVCFFSALLYNKARGLNIDCGCFGTARETTKHGSMTWYLIRDGMIVLLGLFLFFRLAFKAAISKPPQHSC